MPQNTSSRPGDAETVKVKRTSPANQAPRPAPGLEILGFEKTVELRLPLFLATVPAGFPSPADDYVDQKLDLNDYLVGNPAATFFVRVHGESMIQANIRSGDILIVDRSLTPKNKSIVIAVLNGELTVKRLEKTKNRLRLVPENPDFPTTDIPPDADFDIWGVVTYVIHKA